MPETASVPGGMDVSLSFVLLVRFIALFSQIKVVFHLLYDVVSWDVSCFHRWYIFMKTYVERVTSHKRNSF